MPHGFEKGTVKQVVYQSAILLVDSIRRYLVLAGWLAGLGTLTFVRVSDSLFSKDVLSFSRSKMDILAMVPWKVETFLSGIRNVASNPPNMIWLLYVSILCSHMCYCQEVSLSLRENDVVFEGVSITLECAVSDSTPSDDITMVMRDESGNEINSGSLSDTAVYTERSDQVNIGTSRHTYSCDVDWMERGFQGNATLDVDPVPPVSPYCFSEYDNGILVGDSLTLVCYHSVTGFGLISWSTNSGVSFTQSDRTLVWGTVQRREITVQPTRNQNGSVFHCNFSPTDETCSIGPINLFDTFVLVIEPDASNGSWVLSSGETQDYRCSSRPRAEAQWMDGDQLPLGIEVSYSGAVLSVGVAADNTFVGEMSFTCSLAETGDGMVSPVTLIVSISAPTTPPPVVTTTGSPSSPDLPEYFIVVLLGGVAALLILIAVFLVVVYVYCRCRRNAKSSIEPDRQRSVRGDDREYAVPPFGFDDGNGGASTPTDDISGQDSYAMVDKTDHRVSPSGALTPPSLGERETHDLDLENGGYTSTGGWSDSHGPFQQEPTSPRSGRLSVLYADPVKKGGGGGSGTGVLPFGGLDEQEEIPSYAAVNKSRHVPIDDSALEDDDDDGFDEDYDDDAYWDPRNL